MRLVLTTLTWVFSILLLFAVFVAFYEQTHRPPPKDQARICGETQCREGEQPK
jgi:hypothetical protein